MKSTFVLFAGLFAAATASDVSVNGINHIFHVFGGSSCSGSDPSQVGMCPGPQEFLTYGSCCVQLPNRASVVMGCMPLRSATDTCSALAASLGQNFPYPDAPATTTSSPSTTTSTSAPATTSNNAAATNAPATNSPATDAPANNSPATNAPATATTLNDSPATASPQDAGSLANALPEVTTDVPIVNGTHLQGQQAMTDGSSANNQSGANAGATSTVTTMAVAVGCCAAALAIVGGVLIARKKNQAAEAAASPNTPPQPLSLPAEYGEESPIDEDNLTPLSAVVCM
ncbi:hypothetical protein THRCLA_04858 [Thraustotheca clavata]|uniref:Secreted protein n=1 Tax=Thraustotheca clavata TaxID=74557 RepID=A0A1V9ZXY6_9STRA|nr:hypothetical protein THRCLA_04858 [Thraustotheca clavata]